MSNNLTLADSINAALNTGHEATFLYNSNLYTFSPAGIITWLNAAGIPSGLGATQAEIDKAADVSSFVQELTASGAVAATTRVLELNHISVAIAATWTVVPNTLFIVKDTSASGTAAHTLTLTGGTFNGTNTVATLNARDDFLMVWFDSAGRGSVIVNTSVVLS
jgi:hypothetical protein